MTYHERGVLELKDRGPYGRGTFDQFASQSPKADNETMSTPTREELDAKFERTEARVDARLAEFQRTTSEALGEIKGELKAIHADLGNLKSLKWQIWTSMAAAVALVFGIVTYGASTFESGRNTAVVVHDAQQKIDETAAAMKKQQEETQKLLQEAIKAITQAQSAKP
jgi:hypothetical protein